MPRPKPTKKKKTKLDFRVEVSDKERMHEYAAAANYREREFSVWARRVLLGEEVHPNFK